MHTVMYEEIDQRVLSVWRVIVASYVTLDDIEAVICHEKSIHTTVLK